MNNSNVNYLFGNSEGRTAHTMLNYASSDFSYGMGTSVITAENAMGTSEGLYAGVWIVSMDRRWTALNQDDNSKKCGICLWGEHASSRFWSYNSGADAYIAQTNYQALLERGFSGGNRNPLNRPAVRNSGNNWEADAANYLFLRLPVWRLGFPNVRLFRVIYLLRLTLIWVMVTGITIKERRLPDRGTIWQIRISCRHTVGW